MTTHILITGGLGFIGSHLVEHIHRHTSFHIIIIDCITYASMGVKRLRSSGLINSDRIRLFTLNLTLPINEGLAQEICTNQHGELIDIQYIVHMAAETHVDNSIKDPVGVIHNNVMSTLYLLEFARTLTTLDKFIYFSTDEVYGSAPEGVFYTETDRHNPTNPYSASKSAAEQLCTAYHNTYRIPVLKVNVMNAFGERQHVEKFIPKCIRAILNDDIIYIHSNHDCSVSGSRSYIHARNIASAVLFLITKGRVGELYHITGQQEVSNLDIAFMIAEVMGMKDTFRYRMVNYHADRPGHDLRYALDGTKLAELGWSPPVDFKDSLTKTILWTLQHPEWLEYS